MCSKVCASYSTMVNKNDAIGWQEWRNLPYEQQMGFRIPISVMIDLPRLRARHPVITASEYLRLHGQDPESESSSGYWDRDSYISHPYVFESNKTKTPTQFVIENHWYDPQGTNRVNYIPQSMKNRGKWERHPGPEIGPTAGYWPDEEPTEISIHLTSLLPEDKSKSLISWDTAKTALNESQPLGLGVDLDNDKVVEQILNDNGWEVLHTFESVCASSFLFYTFCILTSFHQVSEWNLPSLLSSLSKKSYLVQRYEASRRIIIMSMRTSLYLPERLISIVSQ
jgi:hypothetical protein